MRPKEVGPNCFTWGRKQCTIFRESDSMNETQRSGTQPFHLRKETVYNISGIWFHEWDPKKWDPTVSPEEGNRSVFSKGFTPFLPVQNGRSHKTHQDQVNVLVVGCSPELDGRLQAVWSLGAAQSGMQSTIGGGSKQTLLICHWRRAESQNVWKKQWMVETGHGTGDNFTGQVIKKKERKTYTHIVQRRLVCLLMYLWSI